MARFVDTNVLLYAIDRTEQGRPKAEIARRILDADDLVFSTQVFAEFYTQATRVTREHRISHEQAVAFVDLLTVSPVQAVSLEVFRGAVAASERFRISYWDAAILEAARVSGCEVVLSEDLAHGQDYDGVRVENPFST